MKELLGLFAVFLVIAFIVNWWKVIVGVILAAAIAYGVYAALTGWLQLRKEAREREAERVKQLIANANSQHHSYLKGHDRGLYGSYKPVDLDKL